MNRKWLRLQSGLLLVFCFSATVLQETSLKRREFTHCCPRRKRQIFKTKLHKLEKQRGSESGLGMQAQRLCSDWREGGVLQRRDVHASSCGTACGHVTKAALTRLRGQIPWRASLACPPERLHAAADRGRLETCSFTGLKRALVMVESSACTWAGLPLAGGVGARFLLMPECESACVGKDNVHIPSECVCVCPCDIVRSNI